VEAFLSVPRIEWERIRIDVETVAVLAAGMAERPVLPHGDGAPSRQDTPRA
jgi:hypothetical protein